MTLWYVVQCYSGDERAACERFLEKGWDFWRHELIPGYAMVKTSQPSAARYVEGVIRVLPFSDRPQSIHGDVVAVLQETCRAFEEAAAPKDSKPDQPIAGMARKLVANLFASAGFSVKIASERVELTTSSPLTGRQHSAHQRRRAVRAVAGA